MARLPRLAVGGLPHLVVQRTAARRILVDDEEAGFLLAVLRDAVADAAVAVHGYALLPQAVWLLATPADAGGISRAMQSIGRRYVRWLNERRGERGGLFSGRYRAALLQPDTELLPALRYVELQPVSGALTAAPEDYRWSSCRHHLGLASDPALQVDAAYWALGNTPFDRQAAYRDFLRAGVMPECAARFDQALAGGWVLGSPEFVRQIAGISPRRPQRARAGRPRRVVAATADP
ncbi:MAG TPA: transposase [Burkholderiaceae bacterium]|nr:transposase [Burkholderiaceae bacterium]